MDVLQGSSGKVIQLLNLLRQLQYTTSRREKINLVSEFPYPNMVKKIFSLVMDPEINFGFTSESLGVGDIEYAPRLKKANARFQKWINLLIELSQTDNYGAYKGRLLELLEGTVYEERWVMLSILNKRLSVGIDFGMAQKLWGTNFIVLPKDFMKAGCYDPSMVLDYPIIVEPNIDGERHKLLVTPDGICKAYDVSFAHREQFFEPYFPELTRRAKKHNVSIEVDVILFSRDWTYTFNIINNSAMDLEEKRNILRTYVVDIILDGQTSVPYNKRIKRLESLVVGWKDEGLNVRLIPGIEVSSEEELFDCRAKVKSPKGIILKDPNSPYSRKRDSYWLKAKPETLEVYSATIQELILKAPGNVNSLCGFVLKNESNKKVILTQFQSDCNSQQRLFLAEKGNSLIGTKIEYKLDANGKPIFYRLRPNRTVNG